jgi:hypothetical protein
MPNYRISRSTVSCWEMRCRLCAIQGSGAAEARTLAHPPGHARLRRMHWRHRRRTDEAACLLLRPAAVGRLFHHGLSGPRKPFWTDTSRRLLSLAPATLDFVRHSEDRWPTPRGSAALVANVCTSAAAACPLALAKARWMAARSSKCSVASNESRKGPGVATGPWLTSYFLRPGIFFAIGTWASK